MVIEDKYFDILHTLIYDKRSKMSGILSSFEVNRYISGYGISFQAFMNKIYNSQKIFAEDFESGNVVFLLPFGLKYKEKEMKEMAGRQREIIKAFFGDKFREDMIMEISEDERQEEIREWEKLTIGLENWDRKLSRCEN